jgi:hypothetical protein
VATKAQFRRGSKVARSKSSKVSSYKQYELSYRDCSRISASLSDKVDVTLAKEIRANVESKASFNGQMLGHEGFLITEDERREILKKDKTSREVMFPYLNGREMLSGDGRPQRYVIDFQQMTINEASKYRGAFEWVKERVLPDREKKAEEGVDSEGNVRPHHKAFLARWWQLSFGRPELLQKISRIQRYICCSLVTKRAIFVFVDSRIRPSNLLQVFTFEDDYTFGILQSTVHWVWFAEKSSKLKTDYRFGEGVWNTFPWPQSPTPKDVRRISGCKLFLS